MRRDTLVVNGTRADIEVAKSTLAPRAVHTARAGASPVNERNVTMSTHETTLSILRKLISFPTLSCTPNIDLIHYVRERLERAGACCELVGNEDGTRANLFASVGPVLSGGVVLSGHTDVVPTEGQDWTVPPFELTSKDSKHFGRGTADMKGFVAAAVHCMERAARSDLRTPLHLALSFDEEVGCLGVRSLLPWLSSQPFKPRFCIVGEPTAMGVATGHKGKVAMRAHFTGKEAHSALAPSGLNALHLAVDFVQDVRDMQERLVETGNRDGDYDVPYSTLHVGILSGGTALNIVPNRATADFELRSVAADQPDEILRELEAMSTRRVAHMRETYPQAAVRFERVNSYPGLGTAPDSEIVSLVKQLSGANQTLKVAFGTEGGLFSDELGLPVVVCGPGSMDQGHKPDEYVTTEQLQRCEQMLDALVELLRRGL
jgi:acetylornithine deacetylase